MLIQFELRVSEVEQLQLLSHKLAAAEATLPICHNLTALTRGTICVGPAEQGAAWRPCLRRTDTSVLAGC